MCKAHALVQARLIDYVFLKYIPSQGLKYIYISDVDCNAARPGIMLQLYITFIYTICIPFYYRIIPSDIPLKLCIDLLQLSNQPIYFILLHVGFHEGIKK